MPTHGSMTKAGKVRNQTPKIAAQPKRSTTPRTRNKHNYVKRLVRQPQSRERRFRR